MDLNKLSTSDKVIAGSGIVLFVAYFLPWFTIDLFGDSVSASGGDVGFLWSTFPMLLGLLLAGTVIATKVFDVKLPELPFPVAQAYLGIGGLCALLVVLKLLIGEEFWDRSFGLVLAAIAAIGLAVGGYLKLQDPDDVPPSSGPPGSAPF